jgi:hypothetical protein
VANHRFLKLVVPISPRFATYAPPPRNVNVSHRADRVAAPNRRTAFDRTCLIVSILRGERSFVFRNRKPRVFINPLGSMNVTKSPVLPKNLTDAWNRACRSCASRRLTRGPRGRGTDGHARGCGRSQRSEHWRGRDDDRSVGLRASRFHRQPTSERAPRAAARAVSTYPSGRGCRTRGAARSRGPDDRRAR